MQRIPEEQRLAAAALGGDRAAFEQIYQAYYPAVYALAYSTVRERNTAEAILRDTFSAARSGLGGLPADEPFGRWVQRIAFVQCDAYLRRTGRPAGLNDRAARELLADADPETFRLPLPYTTEPELQARLERVVSRLPDTRRCALTLYYNNGLSLGDTAAVMGVRPEQARSELAYARREIVRSLREAERAEGRELPWGDASQTTPYRNAAQVPLLSGMIAGGVAGLILDQVLAASAGSAAGGAAAGTAVSSVAGSAAVSTVSGTAVSTVSGAAVSTVTGTAVTSAAATAGVSAATKIIIGVTAAAVIVGGGVGVTQIVKHHRANDTGGTVESTQTLEEVRCYNAEGTLTFAEQYDYDENCMLIRSTASEYDGDGTPVYEDMEHTYEYDDSGRAVTVRIGTSPVIEYEYDDAGRLIREYQGDSNGNPITYTYEYDADGHRIRMRQSYSGNNESSWSVTETQNEKGDIHYDMTLESGEDVVFPQKSDAYDEQGRHIMSGAEGTIEYFYHDEKMVTLMEVAAGDGLGEGSPYAGLTLVFLDAVNREFHSVYLGVGADAAKTYDDDGRLARLDFTDGSYAEFSYRDSEAKAAAETSSPEQTAPPVDTGWKQAYQDYLTELRADNMELFDEYFTCDLIYLNDDDIPELVIHTGIHADGGVLCTYVQGQVVSQHLAEAYGSYYMERGNLLLSSYGISGVMMQEIFAIHDNRIELVARGDSGPDPNDPANPDANTYKWNDAEVSKEEYDQELNKLIDAERAKQTGGENAVKGAEAFDYIERF